MAWFFVVRKILILGISGLEIRKAIISGLENNSSSWLGVGVS